MTCVLALFLWVLLGEKSLAVPSDSVAYHPRSQNYILFRKDSLGTWQLHQVLSREEYLEKRRQIIGNRHFRNRNQQLFLVEEQKTKEQKKPNLSFNIHGTLSLGLSQNIEENINPSLPIDLQKRSFLNFTQRTNIHAQANFGERLGLDVTYNTETGLLNQRQRLNLYYSGEEYDLIQRFEAGNIRFHSNNPLISIGGEELVGLKGSFKLGALDLQLLASQERSEERRLSIRGGQRVQRQEIKGSEYDFAQHFFLSEFFAQKYDDALSNLPLVESDIYIERIEVWVSAPQWKEPKPTTEEVRGFSDIILSKDTPPADISRSGENGLLISSAERLPQSAYTYHPTLGFLSLHTPLAEGQVLMVSYRYRYQGEVYQVGTFEVASDGYFETALLANQNHSPSSHLWHLMMKNGYSLSSIPKEWTNENLRIELLYKDYQSGLEQSLVEKGEMSGTSWLTLFGWDRMDSSGAGQSPDGLFDMIQGVTYLPDNASIFIPLRRPFEAVPKELNSEGNNEFPVYSQLYDSSKYDAEQLRELNRFIIRTEVEGAIGQSIMLGSSQLNPGSVKVVSGAQELEEGKDFQVDYTSGQLTLAAHLPENVEVIIQEPEYSGRKFRKTLHGTEANLTLFPGLRVGTTLLHYSEESLRQRIRWGEEALSNMMWGVHFDYKRESQSFTEWLNRTLRTNLSETTRLELQGAYALLRSKYKSNNGVIILEDFEQGQPFIDLTFPEAWSLASPPPNKDGETRAQLAWYTIDPILVREGAVGQPSHLKENPNARTHPFIRELKIEELFPKHDYNALQNSYIQTLHLSYYPEERGPYNLNTSSILPTGKMEQPNEMWGGIMRPLEVQNLQQGRFAYIEGWLLDPFFENPNTTEGTLLIDLGTISDEILPDGVMNFESALPKEESAWGKSSSITPQVYGFDYTGTIPIEHQDVGLDGLTSSEERIHPLYGRYLEEVERVTNFTPWKSQLGPMPGDPASDPAGDDYHFFLGDAWDRIQADIPTRYKYINGVEGNSINKIIQGVQSARTWLPDTEDLDRNMIHETEEQFLRYHLPISTISLANDAPFIVGERIITPVGSAQEERWVKVRIPLKEPFQVFGSSTSLENIKTIRFTLTDFSNEIHLRWARLRLVANPWAHFEQPIDYSDRQTAKQVTISTLSSEEDEGRSPIPYVSPPGVAREQVQTQLALIREDEKALSLEVQGLEAGQPVAVYQEVDFDLRHFETLELFVHLESPLVLRNGDLEFFIRLGHDFTENYYEFRMPLQQTPIKSYEGFNWEQLQKIIWPDANKVSLQLSLLTELKNLRLTAGTQNSEAIFTHPHPQNESHTLVLRGHPTLGDISAILIGVRSCTNHPINAEIWFNELTASGSRDAGGHALQASGELQLADLGGVSFSFTSHSAGFGSIKSNPRKGAQKERHNWYLRANLDLGKILPYSWHLQAPISYTLHKEQLQPQYALGASDISHKNWYHMTGNSDGTTQLKNENLILRDWHIFKQTDERKSFLSPTNFHFSYELRHQSGHTPQLQEQYLRRSSSNLSYNFEHSRGKFIRLSSYSNRQYHRRHFAEGGKNLQTRWDWIRSLNVRWRLLPGLHISWQSKTNALIQEPFEVEFRGGGNAHFQLLSKEILQSIANLGETMHYQGNTEIGYVLPKWEQKALRGLAGSLQWQSRYQWDKGIQQGMINAGNHVQNASQIQLQLQYNFLPLYQNSNRKLKNQQKSKHPFWQSLHFHYRRQDGSSIPGFLPEAGKALGFSTFEHALAPSFDYYFSLTPIDKSVKRIVENGWILNNPQLSRHLSYYSRDEINGFLKVTPLDGLLVEMQTRYNEHRHTELHPLTPNTPTIESGSMRFSTIGLKRFFQSRGGTPNPQTGDIYQDFLSNFTPSNRADRGLPSLLSISPNWMITYELPRNHSWIRRNISAVRLRHHYRGEIEVPRFLRTTGDYEPQSVRQVDEMNPVIGLEVELNCGLSLESRHIRRRTSTISLTSTRLLQQLDQEIYSRISYQHAFAPLFQSYLPLLSSSEHKIALHFSHTFSKSIIDTHLLQQNTPTATKGLVSHLLNCTAEYTFSRHISLRAFYELTQRTPLVTNYLFPVRHQSYGVILTITN